MEVAAVAWRQGQEHLQNVLVSGVEAEPHHADTNIVGSPIKEGATVTGDKDDIPEYTTVTGGGVVVVAMVVET